MAGGTAAVQRAGTVPPGGGGHPVRQIYRKNAFLRVVQSRHIRHSDRAAPKGSYYANKARVNCPSCGAVIELNSQQVVCPYCGGVLESDFYDWQTETFELYEVPVSLAD